MMLWAGKQQFANQFCCESGIANISAYPPSVSTAEPLATNDPLGQTSSDQASSEVRFHGVVAGAVADIVFRGFGPAQYVDLDAAKIGKRCPVNRIVGQQILRAQFVADFLESVVKLRDGGRIIMFTASIFGKLDEGVLASGFAPRAVFDGHHDNAVDDGFRLLCRAHGLFVVYFADGVAPVSDQDNHLAPP